MGATIDPRSALDHFNMLPDEEATTALMRCCASSRWADTITAGRPYDSMSGLLDAGEAACRDLTDAEVSEALSAHPRIGDRARGASTEAQWSRAEQASVADADHRTRAELHAGNVAYEQRFGRVFLIRASGRSPAEMLAELRRRLVNDPDIESREVAAQLCEITRLRLERLLAP